MRKDCKGPVPLADEQKKCANLIGHSLKISRNGKQEAHGPHRSPEKRVQINKHQ